jgi:hypothetical protein
MRPFAARLDILSASQPPISRPGMPESPYVTAEYVEVVAMSR